MKGQDSYYTVKFSAFLPYVIFVLHYAQSDPVILKRTQQNIPRNLVYRTPFIPPPTIYHSYTFFHITASMSPKPRDTAVIHCSQSSIQSDGGTVTPQ